MLSAIRVAGRALRDTYDALVVLAVLNLMWVAACFTVVLLPAATAALFEMGHHVATGRQPGLAEYPRAILRHFGRSWMWAAVNILVLGVVGANLLFYGGVDAGWSVALAGVFGGAGMLWVVAQLYFWPYMFLQDVPRLRLALRNAIRTVFGSPGFTLGVAAVAAVVMALSVLLLIPIAVFTGAFLAVFANHAVRNRLQAYGTLPHPENVGESTQNA